MTEEIKTPMIYQRIADAMKDIGAIGKTQKNKVQGFMYRGIDDVYSALQPILAKHEVFTVPEVMEDRTEERQTKSGGNLLYRILNMKYTFYTVDGSQVSCRVIGEAMDSGDKATNKAMAISHKYALLQVFCIPTEEIKDPDAESHEVIQNPITDQQAIDIPVLQKKAGITDKDFVDRLQKKFKVKTIDELSSVQAWELIRALEVAVMPSGKKE